MMSRTLKENIDAVVAEAPALAKIAERCAARAVGAA